MVLIYSCLHKLQQYQFFQKCSQILDFPIIYNDIAQGYRKNFSHNKLLIILAVQNPQQPQKKVLQSFSLQFTVTVNG